MERTCQVLEYLTMRGQPATLTEVTSGTGLHRTVIRRIITTLSDFGLVTRQGQSYALGPKSLALARAHLEQSGLQRLALPLLLDLRESLLAGAPRTLMLSVPVGSHVVIVERIFGHVTPVEVIADVGSVYRLSATAMGRCLLAQLPSEWVSTHLTPEELEPIQERLALIRTQEGVEFSTSPYRPMRSGINSIATPVFNQALWPVACLCIIGTDLQPHLSLESPVARALLRGADSLTSIIGGRLPPVP